MDQGDLLLGVTMLYPSVSLSLVSGELWSSDLAVHPTQQLKNSGVRLVHIDGDSRYKTTDIFQLEVNELKNSEK
jgi:hypothetical protein